MQISSTQYPIPLIIKNILTNQYTGKLAITGLKFDKILYFNDGNLVFAESSAFDEKLGITLYLLGKISEEQYNYISGLAQSMDLRVGEILIQNNFISENDLAVAMIYLIKKIAINSFIIEDAELELLKRIPIDYKQRKKIPLPPIIAEGARKISNITYFKNKIQFFTPLTVELPTPIRQLLSNEEIHLYEKLKTCGNLSNSEIISRFNLDPVDYWEKLILFILLEIINFYQHKNGENISDRIHELIQMEEKLKEKKRDFYNILNIKRTATIEEIKDSLKKLSYKYSSERFGSAAAPEIKRIAHFVTSQIDYAYNQLMESRKMESDEIFDLRPEQLSEEPEEKESIIEKKSTYQRAEDLYQQAQYQDAANILKQAIKKEPTKGDYYYLLGLCLTHIPIFHDEAEERFKKAIKLKPWSSDPIYALGILYRMQNKKILAAKCFEKVLSMTASHNEAAKAMRELIKKKKEKSPFISLLTKEIKLKK